MSSHGRRGRMVVKERLKKMSSNRDHVYVLHYSSEGFVNPDTGGSPRITSIAVRNFASGQTTSFSIHMFAELDNVAPQDITSRYNDLEKKMLEEFYQYVKEHSDAHWVHWNMRDVNFGFAALEHRLSVLGGEPVKIDDQKKLDLSRDLVALYGRGYIKHPRFESLMVANNMTKMDFLSGREEAKAFVEGQYIALHQSTLRKVDTLCSFMDGAMEGTLKTGATWFERNDLHDFFDVVKGHWIVIVLSLIAVVLTITGAIYGLIAT